MTSLHGAHAVAHLAGMLGLKADRLRQVFEYQALGRVIEQLNIERLLIVVADLQLHIAPASQGQAARQVPMHLWRTHAQSAQGIQQGQQQQRQ